MSPKNSAFKRVIAASITVTVLLRKCPIEISLLTSSDHAGRRDSPSPRSNIRTLLPQDPHHLPSNPLRLHPSNLPPPNRRPSPRLHRLKTNPPPWPRQHTQTLHSQQRQSHGLPRRSTYPTQEGYKAGEERSRDRHIALRSRGADVDAYAIEGPYARECN